MAISGGSYRVEDDKANALSNDMKNIRFVEINRSES